MDERMNILNAYMSANVAPILEGFIFGSDIPNSVIIDAKISLDDLYNDGDNSWFKSLGERKILVIDNLDSISKDEQVKFMELFKYRKIGSMFLQDDVVIIVTAKRIDRDRINEAIYSLVVHIEG